MKIIYTTALIFILAAAAFAQETAAKWMTYKNAAPVYSISYPENWQFREPDAQKRLFVVSLPDDENDKVFENVSFGTLDLGGQPMSIKAMEASTLRGFSVLKDFKLIKKRYFQWLGAKAIEFEYTGMVDVSGALVRSHWLHRVVVIRRTLYAATYIAPADGEGYQKHIATAIKIMNSIKRG